MLAHLLPKYKGNTLLPAIWLHGVTDHDRKVTQELNNTCQEAVVAYCKVHVL